MKGLKTTDQLLTTLQRMASGEIPTRVQLGAERYGYWRFPGEDAVVDFSTIATLRKRGLLDYRDGALSVTDRGRRVAAGEVIEEPPVEIPPRPAPVGHPDVLTALDLPSLAQGARVVVKSWQAGRLKGMDALRRLERIQHMAQAAGVWAEWTRQVGREAFEILTGV